MPRPSFSNVRMTIYVTSETAARIRAAAGRRPLGHAVDDAFDLHHIAGSPAARPPLAPKKPSASAANLATVAHPIACQCESCTLARLQSPQIRKK